MPNSTGMKRMASGRGSSRSSASSKKRRGSRPRPVSPFAVCLRNDWYDVDLVKGKVYRVGPDRAAAAEGLIRIIDESAEDYLYPADRFARVTRPPAARRALCRM